MNFKIAVNFLFTNSEKVIKNSKFDHAQKCIDLVKRAEIGNITVPLSLVIRF